MKLFNILIVSFSITANAKSFALQHELVFVDSGGVYPGFSVSGPGNLANYCSFHGYLGDLPITPIKLDGTPSIPLRPPVGLSESTANTIVTVVQNKEIHYENFDGSEGVDFLTEIASSIDGRENSYIVAACRIPAKKKWGIWKPINEVPSVQDLRNMFRSEFLIKD